MQLKELDQIHFIAKSIFSDKPDYSLYLLCL